MLKYDPLKSKYIGDDAMHVYTKQKRKDSVTNDDDVIQGGLKQRG